MLTRHILGYAPSLIVTSLTAFASVTLFTTLMSQAEYGQYALAISAMTMLVGAGFFWLQSASSRLMPQAIAQGNEGRFLATLYAVYGLAALVILLAAAAIVALFNLGDWRVAAWLAAPLAVLRALLNLNQSVHRAHIRIARYNVIEIGQAVIGLALALVFVALLHQAAAGAAAGLLIGLGAAALIDGPMLARVRRADFDRDYLRQIVHFGAPFIVTYGLSFVLSGSDRFLIEYFLGPDQVGIYAAGYAFPDRIGQNLFMAVATASFPLVVRRLEQEGVEAARDQTYINGAAMLALAFPACIGLLLINRQVAATLIGADFRAGAVTIMPFIAVATIFNGLAAHYFDHALHLAKKTRLFFFVLGPAALLNFVGNLYAIPHFGIIGAAYTTLAAYALYLTLSILIGRRVFRIKFPFKPALQIALATALMAAAILALDAPETAIGLATNIITGGMVYALGLLAFNVMGVRTKIIGAGRDKSTALAETASRFEILTSAAQIAELADEWRDLHRRVNTVFGGYDWLSIWWRHLGQPGGATLHIVIMRDEHGKLQAVLPLTVRRSGVLRILEWAGYDVFDYGDVLAASAEDVAAIWAFITTKGGYDIALLKDVHAGSASLPVLGARMTLREQRKNYFLSLDFASGEAWLAAQSRKLRGDVRRKTEKMQARGAVAFHVHANGTEIPDAVVEALYEQKRAWFLEREATGVFARAEMKDFLRELAELSGRQGVLYLAWLSCGDVIVACHMGFVKNGTLYLYITTYDAEFGAFSPGNALMVESIKWAVDQKLRELDFMRGDEAYKQRFASGNRALSAFLASGSRLGHFSILAQALRRKKPAANDETDSAPE